MGKRLFAALLAFLLVFPVGCKKKEEVEDPTKVEHEWTEEEVLDSIGSVVEGNVATMEDYLRTLKFADLYVEGYVVEVDFFLYDVITIADNLDDPGTTMKIHCTDTKVPTFEVGDHVFACVNWFDNSFELPDVMKKKGYELEVASSRGTHCEKSKEKGKTYSSVYKTTQLLNDIYFDTVVETKGIVYKEDKYYYLYPSKESKKNDKYLRIELKLADDSEVIIGKEVYVTGNPSFGYAHFVELWNVYLSKEED